MRNAHTAYYEEEILGASPLRLVCLLYQGAIAELRSARTYLAANAVPERCAAISKACDIIAELKSTLNLTEGGDTAARLDELYSYCTSRLLTANLEKTDLPLAEVLGLLATLSEAWTQIAAIESPREIDLPSPAVYAANAAGSAEFTSQSWSF